MIAKATIARLVNSAVYRVGKTTIVIKCFDGNNSTRNQNGHHGHFSMDHRNSHKNQNRDDSWWLSCHAGTDDGI